MAALAASALVTTTLIAACVDLFHDTDLEARRCDDGPDAQPCVASDGEGPDVVEAEGEAFSFCDWDAATARNKAIHACAWLGACAKPAGNNRFGTCMMNAIAAYDCKAMPNRPVRGAAFAYWDCLWRADDCKAIARCVAPNGPASPCGTNATEYTQCESAADGGKNVDTLNTCGAHLEGDEAALAIESCAAVGQTCAVIDTGGACSGSITPCRDAGRASCIGGHLHTCGEHGVDKGIDCASFGDGKCAPNGAACMPTSDASCADAALGCDGDKAVACPAGKLETVDCAALVGQKGTCDAGAPGAPWDVARACGRQTSECDVDTCDGTRLTSCIRGARVSFDCKSVALGACTLTFSAERNARCVVP
jgi:hypothetical protein